MAISCSEKLRYGTSGLGGFSGGRIDDNHKPSIGGERMMKAKGLFGMAMALLVVAGLLFGTAVTAADKGKANQESIMGVVEKGEKGISVIRTDAGEVFTIIGQNMAEMTGKTVKVTGMLTKGGKNRSVVVSTFEEIKQ